MQNIGKYVSNYGLENHGLKNLGQVYWNLPVPALYEHIVSRGEGVMVDQGPVAVRTGEHTGRSPRDKYVVQEASSQDRIWWGRVNQPITEVQFERMQRKITQFLQGKDVFVFDGLVGADADHCMPVRIVTEYAWHNLFARNMFIPQPDPTALSRFVPQFTVIDAPHCLADPAEDGTRSSTFIFVHFGQRLILVGGSEYSGEIKKGIFGAMNYYLPRKGIMTMHCSANWGRDKNDTALFFGLSGTGKTTLSTDPGRRLVGDDEHGWSDDGIFNFEGGCYAKVIKLDPAGEPEIYRTTRTFGTILENVVVDPLTRTVDLDDDHFTENTRASYPITHLESVDLDGRAGHPSHIFFLTADAFAVLPPISRLTREQALYHFLSGYTAKVAGTERGVTEPQATFSTCFGEPFLPLHPGEYARLLGERLDRHQCQVWLVNTGWIGAPAGAGQRMKLAFTRRMVTAALGGELNDADMTYEPYFNLAIPARIEGVPSRLLNPRAAWSDTAAYDTQAEKLVSMFVQNFKQYETGVDAAVIAAGPRVPAR